MKNKEIHFETAFQRLEEIARLLEDDSVSLAQSTQLYEEGMKLITLCTQKLNTAEETIQKLSRDAAGNLTTETAAPPAETPRNKT